MPLILGTNSIKDTGYDVANSLRFNDGSSDNLSRTTGTPSNRKKFTLSFWCKISGASGNLDPFGIHTDGNTALWLEVPNNGTKRFKFVDYRSGSENAKLETNRVFRDVSAWMSVILICDSTLSTSSDRLKLYINGVRETSFANSIYPSQNYDFTNNVGTTTVGKNYDANYFDGYLAEFVYCDGQALAHTDLGEFDSDSPNIWKPIDVSGLTFGNEGFYLDFENASSLGADVSGNGNNFTVNNLTSEDSSTDTCTNNFITLNPLDMTESTGRTFSEGNLTYTSDSSNASSARGNFGVNSGKWYYEVKIVSQSGSASSNGKFGTFGFTDIAEYSDPATNGLTIIADGRLRGQGSTGSVVGSPPLWGVGDILMFALDLDNQNLYMGKNGSWRTSAGAFSHGSPTDTIYTSIDTSKFWTPFGQKNVSANNTLSYSMNFGSPAFSISSGNADGDGFGNFEYAVPSGYYALNTKT